MVMILDVKTLWLFCIISELTVVPLLHQCDGYAFTSRNLINGKHNPGNENYKIGIRKAVVEDSTQLCDLLRNSVLGLGPLHYNEEQVGAWYSVIPNKEKMISRILQPDSEIWVATGSTTIVEQEQRVAAAAAVVGMIHFEWKNGHIDLLYVHSNFARCGIASQLYKKVEEEIIVRQRQRRQEQGEDHNVDDDDDDDDGDEEKEFFFYLFVEASQGAKGCFEQQNFEIVEKQDLTIGSITLWNYKMKNKILY